MEKTTLSRSEKLDRIFGTPVYAVLLAIFCNVLWGSAFPFIKLGYRLFSIDSGNTASIFCFAGVRFMLGSFLVLLATVIFTLSGPWNKAVTKKADSFAVCFINLFVGGAALFVLGTALGGHLGSVNPLGILVLLYLAFICGAGYVLWALLMKNNPVSRIAIFGFVNPVVNVLLSAVLNGEPLFRWQYLAALVFVCVGIWLVNKAPAQKEKV